MSPAWFKRREKKDPSTPPKTPAKGSSGEPSVAVTNKGISVSKLLTEELVLFLPEVKEKNQAIDKLVAKLCKVRDLGEPSPMLRKVLDREQGISTTLDTGLSLPHARVDDVQEISTILGLLPTGIPDPKQPELTIRAIFLFFSPNRQDAFTRHLHLLRTVSSLFQPAFIDQLLAAGSPAKALESIRKQEG
ncbi:MAG: PTS sugar transporter subunit IIA [Elusimicrobia bacterium]|nr:PTS sugar transporter subunit IIA [Elusimicrobiota bacterium]